MKPQNLKTIHEYQQLLFTCLCDIIFSISNLVDLWTVKNVLNINHYRSIIMVYIHRPGIIQPVLLKIVFLSECFYLQLSNVGVKKNSKMFLNSLANKVTNESSLYCLLCMFFFRSIVLMCRNRIVIICIVKNCNFLRYSLLKEE